MFKLPTPRRSNDVETKEWQKEVFTDLKKYHVQDECFKRQLAANTLSRYISSIKLSLHCFLSTKQLERTLWIQITCFVGCHIGRGAFLDPWRPVIG